MTTGYVLSTIIVALIGIIVWLIFEYRLVRRNLQRALNTNEQNISLHSEYQATHQQAAAASEQFINAAKLIAIHRTGRENVFTFARGSDFFTIETMGLLNDDVDGWRKQAGITSE